jgi:hypothetical protein
MPVPCSTTGGHVTNACPARLSDSKSVGNLGHSRKRKAPARESPVGAAVGCEAQLECIGGPSRNAHARGSPGAKTGWG